MFSRSAWTAALTAGLLACSDGGGDGGGAGGGGGAPDAGPSSGGGGASVQVGSLLARGGASNQFGVSGFDGGTILVLSTSGDAITLGPTPGLAAKPGWTRPAVALGANPRTISTSGTLAVPAIALGQLLGDDGVHPATALWVKQGVTATVSSGGAGGGAFVVGGPVIVEGTLQTGPVSAGSPDAADLVVAGTLVVLAPGGKLLLRGADAGAGEPGGDGGHALLATAGGLYLFGTVDAAGGEGGSSGGRGGQVVAGFGGLTVPGATPVGGAVVLTGTVDVSGGGSAAGTGGTGGQVSLGYLDSGGQARAALAAAPRALAAADVTAYASGDVTARGGSGITGGAGGSISIAGGLTTVSTGTLDVSGGAVTSSAPAGDAGQILVGPWGGEVWCEGAATLRGGDSGVGTSGRGGFYACGLGYNVPLVPEPAVHFASGVDASGGAGKIGGRGGHVAVGGPGVLHVVAGAVDAAASGATGGGFTGGRGGAIEVASFDGLERHGDVVVTVPLQVSGGDSVGGNGGRGGTVILDGGAVTCGAANADGGDGAYEWYGGDGGTIQVGSHGATSTVTAPLSVKSGIPPGIGGVVTLTGVVTIDGVDVPLVDGVYSP